MRPNVRFMLIAVSIASLVAAGGCGSEVEVGSPNDDEPQQNNDPHQNDNDNDDNDNDDTPVNDVEDDTFVDESRQVTAAHCNLVLDCCTEEDEQQFEDADDCADYFLGRLFGLVDAELVEAYEEDRIDIDDAAVDNCENSIAELSCEEFDARPDQLQQLDGCRDIVVPQADLGDDCTADMDCAEGTCVGADPDSALCEALPAGGEECTHRCSDGYYCRNNECVEQYDDGEDCSDPRGDECLSGHCEPDDPDSDVTDGTCGQPPSKCDG